MTTHLSTLSTLLILATASSVGHADTLLGIYADANYWHTSTDSSQNGVDSDYDSQGQLMLAASLEHGVPLVPNARLRYTQLNADGKTDAKQQLTMNSTDAIAYYELLDNVVSVDVGLGAKFLEGDYKTATTTYDMGKTLPMLYGSVGAKLPFTGLSAKAEAAVAKGSEVDATDLQAEIQYQFIDNIALDVGGKLGYRIMDINYDQLPNTNNKAFDTTFKGPYVGLELHF